jgi:phosphohistidine swiveling domain-containing protein
MPYDKPIHDFDEEFDLKYYPGWVLGTQWFPPPFVPLFVDLHNTWGDYGMQFAPCSLSDPRTKGWVPRIRNGALYLTVAEPTEEEKKQLEPLWREKMQKILQDPWIVWEERKRNLKERLHGYAAFDLKNATDVALVDHWYEAWHYCKYVEECHFYPMYALGQGNIVFRRLLKQLFDIDAHDPVYAQLHSGFENEFTKAMEEMAEVADLAIALDLQDTFKNTSVDHLQEYLGVTENGQKWLERFREYVKTYFYMRRRGLEIATPTWQEDPNLPLADIHRFVVTGGGSRSVEARPRLVQRRKEIEQELLGRVPDEVAREAFQKLMRCSQASAVFSEEHTLYVEMLYYSIVRLIAMEFGRRFIAQGMTESADDTLFLHYDEIGNAGLIGGRRNLRPLVARRRQEYDEYRRIETTHPLFLGDPGKVAELANADVIFAVNVAPPIAKPEDVGATLVGCAGAPGTAEGTALVCRSEEELGKVVPGVILVVPATTASWTPVFNVIKGIVTDGGGYLSHALVIAREFGIPAVVGTQEATQRIKTGQKIRIDGNLGRVWVTD